MNAISVVKPLHNKVIFKCIREHILERNPENVTNVLKHLLLYWMVITNESFSYLLKKSNK